MIGHTICRAALERHQISYSWALLHWAQNFARNQSAQCAKNTFRILKGSNFRKIEKRQFIPSAYHDSDVTYANGCPFYIHVVILVKTGWDILCLQRNSMCFYCIIQDYFSERNWHHFNHIFPREFGAAKFVWLYPIHQVPLAHYLIHDVFNFQHGI